MILRLGAGLAWIGRHGTAALAACIFLGMALPGLSAVTRPYLTATVFALLVLAFLRVDRNAILPRIRRPALLLLALTWTMVGVPLIAVGAIRLAGPGSLDTDAVLALFIATAAPPVMAAPAFIFLLGLDGALSLAITVAALIAAPLTAPVIGQLMVGTSLPLSIGGLALQLALLLAGSLVTAWGVRRLAGSESIAAHSDTIGGLNVLLLLVFAIAAMDGVAATLVDRPLMVLFLVALTFALALAQIGVTLLIFSPASREDAYVIAHTCGTRNMGLMVAAFGGTVPEFTWLWFALGQFPIYLLPMLMKPVARRYSASPNTQRKQ